MNLEGARSTVLGEFAEQDRRSTGRTAESRSGRIDAEFGTPGPQESKQGVARGSVGASLLQKPGIQIGHVRGREGPGCGQAEQGCGPGPGLLPVLRGRQRLGPQFQVVVQFADVGGRRSASDMAISRR